MTLVAVSVYGISTYNYNRSMTQPANITVEELWRLTNQNRQEPLLLDERLNRSARAKCQDMVTRNYFDHFALDGTTPWSFIQHEIGVIPGSQQGENLAENPLNGKDLVNAWMNSPKHKKNIVNPAFHNIGFGICKTNTYPGLVGKPINVVVQHFSS